MKAVPFLWYDDNLEQALDLYRDVFPDFELGDVQRHGDKIFTASFMLAGQQLMGLNGGPMYHFTEAFSLFVSVETQDEVDRLWAALTADGGEAGPCGWLKDKFGLSWQIVPTALMELMSDPDPQRAQRATAAMMQMKKLVIADLRKAADGD